MASTLHVEERHIHNRDEGAKLGSHFIKVRHTAEMSQAEPG